MTFPDGVTNPNSLTFTSRIDPLVITPKDVYNSDYGFFFTPFIKIIKNIEFNLICLNKMLFLIQDG